ncbi:monosaccharide ABC transporter membrane protein (CUT2 family) [Promicromonospora sp. AC04]|uniref:ABC transporter permease n=1 Tax=Promicromonospora sp. AC04 TaxID=2135723 RepID=UPI000D3AC136|nr:ABC transporter permease [Promicromonospora sp. AC04]PUB32298.1 monosaccharide ABC transporter membrane protein (CUT2 family) [Promicromonospora sp. AC04]
MTHTEADAAASGVPGSSAEASAAGNPITRKHRGPVAARYAVIGVWILMIVLFAVLRPETFLTEGTFSSILGSQQALVFLSAALLCTILVGEFVDMSLASNFGLAAILVPVLTVNHGWNVWLAALLAVVVSTVVGVVNGLLVVRVGVNTIVVTLGMGTFLLGIALWSSNLMPVSGLPAGFSAIALTPVLGLPVNFFLGLVLMLGFAYVLEFTPLGRNMRFVGANREVSRLAGLRVPLIRQTAFAAGGLIAGVGGVLAAAATGGFDPSVSHSYLLPMFAATFLGTAILQPGRFNPLGTLVAVYFLATGVLGLQLLGGSSWVSSVFYGGVLVVAVTISTVLNNRSR